jgi:hypothetical protein
LQAAIVEDRRALNEIRRKLHGVPMRIQSDPASIAPLAEADHD